MAESGCMVSFSDVVALLETEKVVDQQQAKACDAAAEGALAASATATEENQEAAPVPDHQELSAPEEQAAAEAPASPPAPEEHATAEATEAAPAPEEHYQAAAKKEEVEEPDAAAAEESTRERLKRHRREMAGRVWVPEMWGQEKLLKDWVDCAVFDRPMVPTGLLTARRALIAECCTATRRPADRRTSPSSSTTSSSPPPLRVQNGCS